MRNRKIYTSLLSSGRKEPAMTVTALIAEYNPFHNGHAYHIREARRLTGADFLLVLMSGDFVQRGEPAVIEKSARAEMAVRCGADLVLELPVCYASGSAEYFAGGAVALLNALHCVDYLCFGSECGNLAILQAAARILSAEPDAFRQKLQKLLRKGLSFPAARQEALAWYLAQEPSIPVSNVIPDDPSGCHFTDRHADSEISSDLLRELTSILSQPNNILAIEYLKALIMSGSSIKPVTIRRVGGGYHDTAVGELCSATALRRLFLEMQQKGAPASCAASSGDFPRQLAASVPAEVCNILSDNWQRTFPVFPDDFSAMLHYRLLTAESWQSYAACFDVPEAAARRIFQMRHAFTSFSSFVQLIKTRNFTEALVRRALLHILLGLPQPESTEPKRFPVYYARILGLRRSSGALFEQIKKSGQIPLLSKLADADKVISRFYHDSGTSAERARQMLALDIRSCEIYGAACTAKFGCPAMSEYTRQIFIMKIPDDNHE